MKHLIFLICLTAWTCLAFSEERPVSVLIFLTDDQGYGDLGCYGADDLETPHIDRMALEGMLFTSAYASPVCTPTRASLLTGSHPLRVDMDRVLFTQRDRKGLNPSETTIAEILKAKGYHTAALGKWHLGGQPEHSPHAHGFAEWFGFPSGHNHGRVGVYHRMQHRDRKLPPEFHALKLIENGEVIEEEPAVDTLTERFNQRAIDIIKRTPGDQAFFIYLAHPMPHYPVIPGRKFVGISERGTAYGDTVEELDFRMGEIMNALRETGRDKDTLVVFMSDNGPTDGYGEENGDPGPLRGMKGSTWEGGVRVPCIVWWPGQIQAGTLSHQPITMMDWLPTLADLAGSELPEVTLDGRSLLPLLKGDVDVLKPTPILHTRRGKAGALRLGDWKYQLTHTKQEDGSVRTREFLFNLSVDPGERFNLAGQEPGMLNELRQKMGQVHGEMQQNKRPALKVPKPVPASK